MGTKIRAHYLHFTVFCFLLANTVLLPAQAQKVDLDQVLKAYKKSAANLKRLSYQAQRIDTFVSGGVWNHTGRVLIERSKSDTILGISAFGVRDGYKKEHFYENGYIFEITPKKKKYSAELLGHGFLGSPGGQLVSPYLFYLEAGHRSIDLKESAGYFYLTYYFDDDKTYEITDKKRVVQLDKETYFPVMMKETLNSLGNRSVTIRHFNDPKMNEEVETSISAIKAKLKDYKVIESEDWIEEENPVLNKPFPSLSLPHLLEPESTFTLQKGQLTLLDFWEVWCGPCIKSMPEAQKLQNEFKDKLQVIGISTENPDKARLLLEKKGVSFLNLQGDDEVIKSYDVSSFPTYYLIDDQGIVVREYNGLDYDRIKEDINQLLD